MQTFTMVLYFLRLTMWKLSSQFPTRSQQVVWQLGKSHVKLFIHQMSLRACYTVEKIEFITFLKEFLKGSLLKAL